MLTTYATLWYFLANMRSLSLFLFIISTTLMAEVVPNPQAVLIKRSPEYAQNVIFTVAFPRSGQNWLNALMQIIGKHPAYPLCGTFGLVNPMKIDLDFSKKPFYMMHNPHWISQASSESNQLIVIIRDYKECFIRQAIASKKRLRIDHVHFLRFNQKPYPGTYYDILQLYDDWHPANRYLIYYEDLIKDPENVLRALNQFLGNSQEGVTYLMKRYEHFKALSIANYNNKQQRFGGSMSKGASDHFHSQKHSLKSRLLLQKRMIDINPVLHDKYLSRYVIQP